MTDTADASAPTLSAVKCRHCGAKNKEKIDLAANPGWLCPKCEQFQDQTPCPVCHHPVRIEFLPPEFVPVDKSQSVDEGSAPA